MAELVRGSIADRPWGLTFAQFGLRAITGQLTVHAIDGKDYCVAFDQGSIVGATSSLTADSAIRVALTANLITSSQVQNITRAIAARPGDDDIEVIAATCKLDIMQSLKLRRRVTVQRAARTFAVENGTFVLVDEIAIPTAYDAAVDLRAVVYQGARMNLSEIRMISELRDLGSHFTLGESARVEELGLDATALPIIDALRAGASVAELEARHRDLDPRTIQSVVYALVVCRDAKATGDAKQAAPPVAVAFKPNAAVPKEIAKTDSGTQRRIGPIVEVDARPRTPSGPQTMPIVERSRTPSGLQTMPIIERTRTPSVAPPRTTTPQQEAAPASELTTAPSGAVPRAELRTPPSGAIDTRARSGTDARAIADLEIDRSRPPTGPRAIAELQLDAPGPQRTPTKPMLQEPRPPASSAPEHPRTSTRQAAPPLRPPAQPAAAATPDTGRTATKKDAPPLRTPAEPAASDSFTDLNAIGLPGLEEEPTRSRNLVGSLDLGPPDLPRAQTAPVVGRVSSAFDFLDPGSAVIGSAVPPARYEEPTLRAVDLARVAGTPPDLPNAPPTTPAAEMPAAPRMTLGANMPTRPSAPHTRSSERPRSSTSPPSGSSSGSFGAARPQSPTNSPSTTDPSRSPSGSVGAAPQSPTNPPSGTSGVARPQSPTNPPSGTSGVSRPQSPTNPPGGSFIAARPQSPTNPPSGTFIAARSQTPTNPPSGSVVARSPTPANPPSGSVVARSQTPSNPPTGSGDRPRPPSNPPSSPPLRPKTLTQPRIRTPSSPPSDGAPSEIAFEPSERRRALAEATEAYERGRQALRDGDIAAALEELTRASTLNPHEFDHSAMLAWAQCVAASPAERSKAAEKARKMLTHATQKSPDPEQARFHLGQLEKLLGRDKDALVLFQAVLRTVPDHAGAKAEIAALESKADKGLLGLFKKKT